MLIKCAHTEVIDIDLLVPNPRNPNQHPKKQLQLYAKLLRKTGWRKAITVSKQSGFMVTGHGALEAAKLNGWTKAPIDRQDYENEADEYSHMIADNKLAELAELNLAMVEEDTIKFGEGFDFDMLGIPDFKLDPEDPENKSGELVLSDFHKFDHECPKCGFGFNDEK